MNAHTLHTLTDLCRQSRDKAATLLADERRNRTQLASQLELLEGYRNEYESRLQGMMEQGTELATVQNYQQFLASLDHAIEQARSNLLAQDDKLSSCRQDWQVQQVRLSSFDTLQERQRLQAVRQEGRRELHQQDEFNSNRSARHTLRQNSGGQ